MAKYNWEVLEDRYVLKREFLGFEDMHRQLQAEAEVGGPPAPAASLIRKIARKEDWDRKRTETEQTARAAAKSEAADQRKEELLAMYKKHIALGSGLVAMGGNYIKELAAEAQALGQKPIKTLYEAVALIRVGAALEKLASEALAGGRPGPKGVDPEERVLDGDVDLGIVEINAELTDEEWQARRRKNLTAPKNEPPDSSPAPAPAP